MFEKYRSIFEYILLAFKSTMSAWGVCEGLSGGLVYILVIIKNKMIIIRIMIIYLE